MIFRVSLRAILLASLLIAASYSCADIIIFTSETSHALEVANKIQNGIIAPSKIKHKLDDIKSSDTIIALGNDALTKAKKLKDTPIVGSFISYSLIDLSLGNSNIKSLIYSDPSPESISNFIDTNFHKSKIGFIFTAADKAYMDRIKSSLISENNEIVSIEHRGDIFAEMNKLTKKNINLMLIGNNPEVYQSDNVRLILESLFRKRIPVVASTKILVKAGAAVSITPSENTLIRATYEVANQLTAEAEKDKVSTAFFSEKTEIRTNATMVEIFNLQIKEDAK